MNKNPDVSLPVVRRLPRYYRFLSELSKIGIDKISSDKLSKIMGITASQIRQDLNCFGEFGQQGYGYNVNYLRNEIIRILGLSERLQTILIGTGNLGRAVLSYISSKGEGFEIIGAFDKANDFVNIDICGIKVMHIKELYSFCDMKKPRAAILCIPKDAAEILIPNLLKYGVFGFWNFSHYDIALNHKEAIVENVHLNDSLMTLCYRVNSVNMKRRFD